MQSLKTTDAVMHSEPLQGMFEGSQMHTHSDSLLICPPGNQKRSEADAL